MPPSWSLLPSDILDLIFQMLTLPDYFTFYRVCRSWRSVFLERRRLTRPPPCMAISDIDTGFVKVYCLHGDQLMTFHSPKLKLSRSERTVGSSCGWLIIRRDYHLLHLQNPITDEKIELPGFRFVYHVALSAAPKSRTSRDCILVLMSCDLQTNNQDNSIYAWCRLGDKKWTSLKERCIINMMFHHGKLYVIEGHRNSEREFSNGKFYVYTFDPLPKMTFRGSFANISKNNHWFKQQFVQSGTELLLVGWRHHIEKNTVVVEVFKQSQEQCEWLSVENLGDRVLVTNKNCFNNMESFCTQGLMGSRFQANCIYVPDLKEKELVKFSISDGSSQRIPIPLASEHKNCSAKYLIVEWIVAQAW